MNRTALLYGHTNRPHASCDRRIVLSFSQSVHSLLRLIDVYTFAVANPNECSTFLSPGDVSHRTLALATDT